MTAISSSSDTNEKQRKCCCLHIKNLISLFCTCKKPRLVYYACCLLEASHWTCAVMICSEPIHSDIWFIVNNHYLIMIISNWQNCVIHQYHIMKSAHWLICLWNTLIKLSQHFTNNKFLCKIVTAFCKHMNLWLSWCGLDNIYTRTYPIYCIQYIKTPIQYSHVNCTMSLLHIHLLFRLYYKLHRSTHI